MRYAVDRYATGACTLVTSMLFNVRLLSALQFDQKPPQYGGEYHGAMGRNEAALLLGSEDGQYLVRENPRGNIILSFM